ncbi:hypothetical protein HYH02_003391 [Chlamydomonas schloesseri]|uniref:Mitotic checkpoint protein MAD1 n=1 Tax=Chlamydomonas schloesseri TaxID=2026947 RepID=A0A836B9R6_9CHLO|nr:hypothetical protein HYH02_003391 [Chlamydomonas schloesseri]|eukprot:KAG2451610.1 hypothetical protein HYH02_003391 [Chlamydomonas schloesseri]
MLLEQDLAASKQREAIAAQRLSSAEAALVEHKAEQARLAAESEAASARLRLELDAARAEAKVAAQKVELVERMAAKRVEAEQEVLKVAMAQLDELRTSSAGQQAELVLARQHATLFEAEVAALRSSAQHVRLQLLEEELRMARDTLAVVQAGLQQPADMASAGPADTRGDAAVGSPAGRAHLQAAVAPGSADAGAAGAAGMSCEDELPQPLKTAWAAITRALSVPQGLPVAAQAAEATRSATALGEEVVDLRTAVKAKDETLMQLRAAAGGSEAYATELQAQLSDARSRLEKALTGERVAERRAAAIAQERDALRAALGAAGSAASGAGAAAVLPGSLSGQLLAAEQVVAVQQLQVLNEELQKQVDALQAEVAASASAAEAQTMAARTATTRAEAAEQRVKQLEREADGLAAEVAQLQERLGRGELIRGGGVRVLHLRHNPEAEAKQAAREAAVTQLGAENEALRLQVSELEAAMVALQQRAATAATGAGPSLPEASDSAAVASIPAPALGAGVAMAVKDAEITVLRRKVEECEKAMQRLKAVFKERITVFREACYSLFGYRVDMTAEATAAADAAGAPTTFTLKPQHADDPAALLVFRYSGSRMELVPNAFTRDRLSREVETFVRKFNCIPALTANLTMENFQKQTQC